MDYGIHSEVSISEVFLRWIITSVFVRTRTFPRSVVLAQARTEKSDGRTCERLGRSDAGPCPRCTTRS